MPTQTYDPSQYITLEELEKSIKKKAHTKWKELKELLLESNENYTEFWEIAYKDLPLTTKASIDKYRKNPESFDFVNVREYLWLKK
jgi:hypothetical protein